MPEGMLSDVAAQILLMEFNKIRTKTHAHLNQSLKHSIWTKKVQKIVIYRGFIYLKHHVYYVSINSFIYYAPQNNFLEQHVYNNMMFTP